MPHRARDIGSNFSRCEVFATGSGTALVAAGGWTGAGPRVAACQKIPPQTANVTKLARASFHTIRLILHTGQYRGAASRSMRVAVDCVNCIYIRPGAVPARSRGLAHLTGNGPSPCRSSRWRVVCHIDTTATGRRRRLAARSRPRGGHRGWRRARRRVGARRRDGTRRRRAPGRRRERRRDRVADRSAPLPPRAPAAAGIRGSRADSTRCSGAGNTG